MTQFLLRCTCGKGIRLRIEHAGKVGRCPGPGCGQKIPVPAPPFFHAHAGQEVTLAELQSPAPPPAAPASPAPTPQPLWYPGAVADGKYTVHRKLGEGTFGAVWHAVHAEWRLDLAVKELKKLTPQGRRKFLREAQAWIDLGMHPNVATAWYVRELQGVPYLFLEYCGGGSLADWIAGGKTCDLPIALDIAIQLCWGLAHCHTKGIVHRDFKPQNVLMTADGTAKLTDFGTVKFAATSDSSAEEPLGPVADLRQSIGGRLQGTPAFMPPEQWVKGGQIDFRADLYALGVTLFVMFTGEYPVSLPSCPTNPRFFDHWANACRHAHATATPRLRDLRPNVPQELERIVLRCLASHPEERPAAAADAAAALAAVYEQVAGHSHARPEPNEAELLANSLNNKAVSLHDLGLRQAAEQEWEKALQADPYHPETTYNLGLVQWRSGQMTYPALVRRLQEVICSHPGEAGPACLLALVYLERDECEQAIGLLEGAQAADPRPPKDPRLLAMEKEMAAMGAMPIAPQEEPDATLALARDRQSRQWSPVRTFEGHGGAVASVCLGADGRLALSGSEDRTARLWEVATGRCLRTFEGHTEAVSIVCLSADSRFALSCEKEGHLRVWETATGRCLCLLETGGISFGHSASLSADGRHVLGCSKDGVKLWETRTGRCLHTFGLDHRDFAVDVRLDAGGRFALALSFDGIFRRWDLTAGECLETTKETSVSKRPLCLSEDGRYALFRSEGYDARHLTLWEIPARELRTFENYWDRAEDGSTQVDLGPVCFSTCGRYVLSAGDALILWEVSTGRRVRSLKGSEGVSLTAAYLSADGRQALSGCSNGTLLLSEVHSADTQVAPLRVSQPPDTNLVALTAFHQGLAEAREAASRGEVVAAARHLRRARGLPGCRRLPEASALWGELYSRLPRATFWGGWESATLRGHTGWVEFLSLSADGRHALSGNRDPFVDLVGHGSETLLWWDLATGRQLGAFHGTFRNPLCLSWDGQRVLSGDADSQLVWWELATGRVLCSFEGHDERPPGQLCLSADNRLALSTNYGGGNLTLWEVSTGRRLRTFRDEDGRESITSICLSPDGCHALTGTRNGAIKVWELSTGRCVRTLREHERRRGVAVCLSASGRLAVSGSDDETVKVWEVSTGRCLRTLEGHSADVTSVCVSADGRHAISGSGDRTLRLWEVDTGRCLRTFQGHSEGVVAVALSPDGRLVVSASKDSTVRVWFLDWELTDCPPADWDEGARPYVETFLSAQTPSWTENDFERLLHTLGCAGYGWLRSESVRKELERMADSAR